MVGDSPLLDSGLKGVNLHSRLRVHGLSGKLENEGCAWTSTLLHASVVCSGLYALRHLLPPAGALHSPDKQDELEVCCATKINDMHHSLRSAHSQSCVVQVMNVPANVQSPLVCLAHISLLASKFD